jgi:hypothetical protein
MGAKSKMSAAELRSLLREPSSATDAEADDVPLNALVKAKAKAAKANGAPSKAKAKGVPKAEPGAAKASPKVPPPATAKGVPKAQGPKATGAKALPAATKATAKKAAAKGLKRKLSGDFAEVS